jgi:hypothetical protein
MAAKEAILVSQDKPGARHLLAMLEQQEEQQD